MISTLNDLKRDYDIVMIKGHNVLHPSGFGLASQVGMIIDKTTLGVAKRLIVRSHIVEGNHFPELLLFRNKIVGAYLNGFYVSLVTKYLLNYNGVS